MFLTIAGPNVSVTHSGRRCQTEIAAANLAFDGPWSGTADFVRSRYSQWSGVSVAPHCSLKWCVPAPRVERPKSNVRTPNSNAFSSIVQYNSMFGQCCRYSRSDDAHGTMMMSLKRSAIAAATGTRPNRTTYTYTSCENRRAVSTNRLFGYTGVPRSRMFLENTV